MWVYVILFLMILFPMISPSDNRSVRNSVFFFEVLAAALLCGISDMMGGFDRYIYGQIFDNTAQDIRAGWSLENTSAIVQNPTELGWGYYNILLAYLTPNRYIFILIHTLIVYAMYAWHMKHLSPYPEASFFVLMCIMYFFTWTYLRQTLACGIAWFAIPFAIKRKPLPFFAIVALAASFHNSALLFAMVYFVANRDFSRKELVAISVVFLFLGFTPLGTILFDKIGGQINEDKAEVSLSGVGSARVAYIVEGLLFLYVIYKAYDQIGVDKKSACLRNIALCFILVLAFFVRFPDGGRMTWFFMIGIACTTGQIIAKLRPNNKLRAFMIIVFTVLFFRLVWQWDWTLIPYKSFLTNGVKENDIVWEAYEYDHNYDVDKFYNLK